MGNFDYSGKDWTYLNADGKSLQRAAEGEDSGKRWDNRCSSFLRMPVGCDEEPGSAKHLHYSETFLKIFEGGILNCERQFFLFFQLIPNFKRPHMAISLLFGVFFN